MEPLDDESIIGAALHARLVAGDPLAPDDIVERYAAGLVRRLAGMTQDFGLVEEAVADALASYVLRPAQYNPTRLTLGSYLAMSARGDVRNRLANLGRRLAAEAAGDPVELQLPGRNISAGDDPAAAVELADALARLAALVAPVAHDDEERIVLQLMLDGERVTDAYVRALGWVDLPPAQREERLFAMKDRLTKRLRRLPRPSDE